MVCVLLSLTETLSKHFFGRVYSKKGTALKHGTNECWHTAIQPPDTDICAYAVHALEPEFNQYDNNMWNMWLKYKIYNNKYSKYYTYNIQVLH